MENFQDVADQAVSIYEQTIISQLNQEKVSCFLSLAKETGNLWPKIENLVGNSKETDRRTSQAGVDFPMKTHEETNRKPLSNNQETFSPKNTPESFLSCSSVILSGNSFSSLFDNFINSVNQLNIQLLPDDERWLKNICFGVRLHDLKVILEKYINHWWVAIAKEKLEYKKQNAGRLAANTFIREELIMLLVSIGSDVHLSPL